MNLETGERLPDSHLFPNYEDEAVRKKMFWSSCYTPLGHRN